MYIYCYICYQYMRSAVFCEFHLTYTYFPKHHSCAQLKHLSLYASMDFLEYLK